MAEHLMIKRITHLIIGSCLLVMHSAQADALKDPTAPPASTLSSNASTDNQGQPAPAGPVLQSVMIGSHYRAAIINGQKVLLGKKYEQATLIKLDEHEAVLRAADGTIQTLVMDYAIEKKVISPIGEAATAKRKTNHISNRASNRGSKNQSK
jgi:MSHA biogenesis protein MshK